MGAEKDGGKAGAVTPIEKAKSVLPLRDLMARYGFGDRAKKSAKCPFHEDRHNSFSVWRSNGSWRWKCHAGCGGGDEINFLRVHAELSQRDAIKRFLEMAGVNGSKPPFDWRACVDALTDDQLERFANWRGLSGEFCLWLRKHQLIGLCNECIALPVLDESGAVVAAQVRRKDGNWFYAPSGTKTHALVIGNIISSQPIHVFESPWDAFAFMDALEERTGIIITRGCGNAKLAAALIPRGSLCYGWIQNDGPGEKWGRDLVALAKCAVRFVRVPKSFKDLDEWRQGGASAIELRRALTEADNLAAVEVQKCAAGLSALLDALCAFLRRYVVFQLPEQPRVIALWVAHCWALDAFDYTPYLHIDSPEKQCGKTRLLDCLELLTPKPWRAILPSEAVLFRKIERDRPTLLLDEIDGIFSNGKDDRKEALRSLLNAGFEAKVTIPRCVGQGASFAEFRVFCAKALAGIGKLPDTIRDRSVAIQLARRVRDEPVQRFRKRDTETEAAVIRTGLGEWSKLPGIVEALRGTRPVLPDPLTDRQQDICEPLLAVADMAGGEWPKQARSDLITLYGQTQDETESLGVKLLSDIRKTFNNEQVDKFSTQQLLEILVAQETDSPWAGWWERDLKDGNTNGPAQKLARMLKPFKIKACVIRFPDDNTARGYRADDFQEAWKRYLPEIPETP
jgi:hypothetical protein